MRHQGATLLVAAATLVATGVLYVYVPKGLLPQQDTGFLIGVTDAAQDISFPAMLSLQRTVTDAVRQIRTSSASQHLSGPAQLIRRQTPAGFISFLSRESPATQRGSNHRPTGEAVDGIQGVEVFFQAAQDLQIDTRASRTQYQYIWKTPMPVSWRSGYEAG